MSLILAAALSSAAALPACSWDRPGVNPFTGDLVAAVDRYADIPVATRQKLKRRIGERRYDEIATIGRDHIEGRARYADLRDMHFGPGRVCATVSRRGWAPSAIERGLVYCEDGHCLIIPTVCRNLSRVTRLAPEPGRAQDGGGGGGAAVAEAPVFELDFDPPAAGAAPQAGDPPLAALGGGSSPISGDAPSFASGSGVGSAGDGPDGRTFAAGGGSPLPELVPTGGGGRRFPAALTPPAPSPPPAPPVSPIPEPATWWTMAAGLALLGRLRRRRG